MINNQAADIIYEKSQNLDLLFWLLLTLKNNTFANIVNNPNLFYHICTKNQVNFNGLF